MAKREVPDARPRYRQVADDLTVRLASGEWPVGAMMPTETELCTSFNVSRHTVREALRLIEEAGLVQRRQGSGTTVLATEARGRFVQDITGMAGLLQYPEETRLTVLRAREATLDAEAARLIGVAEGERWLRLECIRRVRVTTAPICYSVVHIRAEYAAVVDDIGELPGSLFELIERRFGVAVAAVELDLSATGVPAAQADLLEVAPGAPALLTRRRYMDAQGRVFEQSVGCHPAPRFTYRATLKREA
jgi:DNA-binding GntR family transcriptional regulator